MKPLCSAEKFWVWEYGQAKYDGTNNLATKRISKKGVRRATRRFFRDMIRREILVYGLGD